MAKVRLSALISDIKGKLEGSVFKGSLSGLQLQNNSYQVGRNTQRNQANHIRNKSIVQLWRELTEAERTEWYLNAKSGQTGYNNFYSVNYWRIRVGLPILTAPSYASSGLEPIDFDITMVNDEYALQFNRTISFATEFVIIEASYVVGNSQQSLNYMSKVIIEGFSNDNIRTISSEFLATYGRQLQYGDRILVKVKTVSSVTGAMGIETRKYLTMPQSLLFDKLIGSPLHAYGFYLFNQLYSGPLIRVKNMFNGNEQDFYSVNGKIDASAVTSWLAGKQGKVLKLYDQAGSSNHLTLIDAGGYALWDGNLWVNLASSATMNFTTSIDWATSGQWSIGARMYRSDNVYASAMFSDTIDNPDTMMLFGNPTTTKARFFKDLSHLYDYQVQATDGEHFNAFSVDNLQSSAFVDLLQSPNVTLPSFATKLDKVGAVSTPGYNNYKLRSFFVFNNANQSLNQSTLFNQSYL